MNQDRILTSDKNQPEIREAELSEKSEALANITASVAHDLEAPLRSLTRFTELLAQEYQDELDEKAQQYLDQIADSGSKMQALIKDLLAYSHAGTGEQTWITVDFNQIVKQIQSDLHSAIAQTQAEFNIHNLPQLLINPQDIYQLWHSLIENALKHSGDTAPKIEINAIAQGQSWLFAVADNGTGIAPEYHSQIFDVFQRLNSHSVDSDSGHGIGLAICQKIVNRYRGKIWVESQVGAGSTFFFSLPMNTFPQSLDAEVI
ncbi:MAG: ATP-binding protein [Cyanobacteria bacterium P01_G01_bin.67]